jgi:hypothetical protein
MHRLLKLQQHKHTGKLLHHRHTSYRALVLILLLTGLVLVYASRQTTADSLYVQAKVPAPIPSRPAVILKPAASVNVSSPNVTIDGSCPITTPAVGVIIAENSNTLGSSACDSTGSFSAEVALTTGKHVLLPRIITVTGDNGPDGTPIDITYDDAAVPTTPAATKRSPATSNNSDLPDVSSSPPLSVAGERPFVLFGPNKTAELTASFTGGQAPYAATIDWGDTTVDIRKNLSQGWHTFSHHYAIITPWTIHMDATDAAGVRVTTTFAALTAYISPAGNLLNTAPTAGTSLYTHLAFYSAYLSAAGVVGALWLHAIHAGYAHAMVPNRGRPSRARHR